MVTDGASFVALAEDLEEQFRAGGGQRHEAQLVDDEQIEAGQLPLQVEQSAVVPGLHEFVDQGRGGGETHRHSPLADGQAQSQGDVGLAGAAVADGDDVLAALDVFTPGQLHDQWLVQRRDGQEVEGVQALGGGEARRADAALHHALVAVDEFQFGETQQVVRVIGAFGGRYSLRKVGSFSSLRWCSRSSVDRALMLPSPTRGSCSPWRGWSAR